MARSRRFGRPRFCRQVMPRADVAAAVSRARISGRAQRRRLAVGQVEDAHRPGPATASARSCPPCRVRHRRDGGRSRGHRAYGRLPAGAGCRRWSADHSLPPCRRPLHALPPPDRRFARGPHGASTSRSPGSGKPSSAGRGLSGGGAFRWPRPPFAARGPKGRTPIRLNMDRSIWGKLPARSHGPPLRPPQTCPLAAPEIVVVHSGGLPSRGGVGASQRRLRW